MAKANYKRLIHLNLTFSSLLAISLFLPQLTTQATLAHHGGDHGVPIIYSITPQFIQQGQITTSVVSGVNLNSSVVGVIGGGVYGFILKEDPQGNSLTIQFAAQPTSELGERQFFIRTPDSLEATFPIKVIPSGAPVIESIYPNSANVGSTTLLYLTGMGLTNPVVTAASDQFLINSFRSSSDGTVLYLSVSLTPNIVPGIYQVYVNTIGGQAQADFIVSSTDSTNSDSFADPYSPGIYSVEASQTDKTQIVLKGSMFDPNPSNNMVTLIEYINGTATGREVNVVYSDTNELIVKLPDDLNSDSISFAVSSTDGKSSNIKTVDLSSLHNNNTNQLTDNNSETVAPSNADTYIDLSSISTKEGTNLQPNLANNSTTTVADHMSEDGQDVPLSKGPNKAELTEDTNVIQNIQNISQYLFSSSTVIESKNETISTSIDEIKDPAKLISSIEENKQIKNQVDLIMLALNDVKQNQDLSETLKKAEALKNKVNELEKLLTAEKQKNNPNQRRLAKYQQLLATADAESRSQTFALLNNLLKYKPQLKNLLTQRPFDLAAIQPDIPNESVILQYVPTEEGLIIFVVDNKNLKTRINKNVSRDILNREIQAYRQLFEKEIEKIKLTSRVTPISSWKDDKSSTYKKEILPLKEKNVFLYNALIGPVEKDITSKKVIAIIANGWLRYLPFQSLGKPTKDGELHFLISDKSIVYLDSVIAISKDFPSPLSNMSNITVFANPDGTLSGANKEAEIITMLFSKTTTCLVKQPFNTSIINQLAKKADILHLATHGFLDGTDIESSYLVSGKKQNGKNITSEKLFLKDIYDLNLNNSKLVVLSGCDTGKLGSLSNEPDDIVGSLATAFRVAGAHTILASLWKAHDDATKIIMQNFYENIKLGVNKAESLRRAALKVKSNPQYGHPLFWSLFNLIGDWR